MAFNPLSHWMELKNEHYYKSPDTRLHSDFATYAQSPHGLLTRSNAQAFHGWVLEHPKPAYEILEVGVGVGSFAGGFLQEIKKQDEEMKSSISSVLHYVLADFSESMLKGALSAAAKSNPAATLDALPLDASNPIAINSVLRNRSFDLIRINELFSDLPADVFVNENSKPMQVLYDEKMNTRLSAPEAGQLSEWESALLLRMPPGYHIPYNAVAAKAMGALAAHLAPSGWMDLFDYGFYYSEDFILPAPIWNTTLVREFGGQWTVDLNFIYCSLFLRQAGYKPFVGKQNAYVESVVGEVENTDTLDYVPKKKKTTGKQEKAPGKKDFVEREDDSFYHMQIQDVE